MTILTAIFLYYFFNCQATQILSEALGLHKSDEVELEPEEKAYVQELLGKLVLLGMSRSSMMRSGAALAQ